MRTRLALWITPVWFCHVVIWEKQKKGQNLHLSFPFLSSSGIQGFEEEKLASFLSIPLLFWAGKVLEAGALLPCIVVLPCFGGRCVVSLALPWHPKAVDGSHVDLLSTPPCLRSYPNRSTTDLYVCMYIYIHTHTQRERERERERETCFLVSSLVSFFPVSSLAPSLSLGALIPPQETRSALLLLAPMSVQRITYHIPLSRWSYSLFDCCVSPGTCCVALFCPSCTFARINGALDPGRDQTWCAG